MQLTDRQAAILRFIIDRYVQIGEPVSSAVIARETDVGVSPATIRAEMGQLEEGGLLTHPHTSAGRIPTDAGYRYYIDALMSKRALPKRDERALRGELLRLRARHNQLLRSTAQLLAGLSNALAVSGFQRDRLTHRAGFSALLEDPNVRGNKEELERITETFRYLDERVDQLFDLVHSEALGVFVGEENPVEELRNVSMVVSSFRLPSGEVGMVAIVGPRRMQYRKNISLIEFVRGLLES